jgi:hypothetical protein
MALSLANILSYLRPLKSGQIKMQVAFYNLPCFKPHRDRFFQK